MEHCIQLILQNYFNFHQFNETIQNKRTGILLKSKGILMVYLKDRLIKCAKTLQTSNPI